MAAIRSQMSYSFDIFISYRQDPETLGWIKKHLKPLLGLRVRQELGDPIEVFVDEQLEAGGSWPLELGDKLGNSRILVPLWSGDYFTSDWCSLELSHMLAREKQAKLRRSANYRGLIVPFAIHDGDTFPAELEHIQAIPIQQYFNARMAVDSPSAEALDTILAEKASAIANSIQNAPEWRAAWPISGARAFYRQFYRRIPPTQNRPPRYTQ